MEDRADTGNKRRYRRAWLAGRITAPARAFATIRAYLGGPAEWLTLGLTVVALGIAAWSVQYAQWVLPQPSYLGIMAMAVAAGWLLSMTRLGPRRVMALVLLAGLGLAVWQTVGLVTPAGDDSMFRTWLHLVTGLRPNETTIYFAMFLVLVTWVIGAASAWYVMKRRNPWVVAVLGAVMVLVNLSNLPREEHFFLPVYLVAAVLLVGQVNLARQGALLRFSRAVAVRVTAVLVVISLAVVLVAWYVPEPPVERLGVSLGRTLRTDTVQRLWFNIFASVYSKWAELDSQKQSRFRFSDGLSTSYRAQFIITAEEPAYWRLHRYDVYHPWGWESSQVVRLEAEAAPVDRPAGDGGRVVTFTVENKLRTDMLLTLGEFVAADVPVRLLALAGPEDEGEGAATPAGAGDIVAVVSPRVMAPYETYTVTSLVRSFTPEELATAGEDYPPEIVERYLQLPDDFPLNILFEARRVVADAETPYDRVMAVKEYLAGFTYDLEAPAPPEGVDGVEHFLFESKRGVCTSFASAMAVMLRSVGVPARINTGYLEGVPYGEEGRWVLRVRDYHARTEVYFPGYGWVEFAAVPPPLPEEELAAEGGAEGEEIGPEFDFLLGLERSGTGGGAGGGAAGRGGTPDLLVYLAVLGVPVALYLLFRLGYAYWLARLKRVEDPAEVFWRMCQLAALGRLGPLAWETPLEYGSRLAAALPSRAQSIDVITRSYVETRYSPRRELGRLQKGRMQKSWVDLCPYLVRRLLSVRRT